MMETTNEAIERLKDEGIIKDWKTCDSFDYDKGFWRCKKCGAISSFLPKKCGNCYEE